MASLVESIDDINNTINGGLEEFSEITSGSMVDGAANILPRYLAEDYKLKQTQVDTFNDRYTQGLLNSTQEALVSVVLDDLIDDKQFEYEEAKVDLKEAAKDIAEVTQVAQIIATGNQETVIEAQEYAVTNDLVEIKQEDVDQYNTSIDSMLEASVTKNMIEVYSQDIHIVDTIAHFVIDTQTTQAFFDTVTITIDEISSTALTVEWEGYSMQVESEMYSYFEPIYDLEVMLR
jgi:hypothetical protein